MADIAVSILLENLPRLVQTMQDEYTLLSAVDDKINSLCQELKFIDIFLKSSSGKRNDPFVEQVVRQIRAVAFRAEDVVEDYASKVAQYRDSNALRKLFRSPKHALMLHGVDGEIETIKKRIEEIYTNKERYSITQGDFTREQLVVPSTAESLRRKRRDVEEKDIVGLEDERAQVIQKLREGDLGRKVVSIIGMGGLGKTTLARKIYNDELVKKEFPSRAWGYVSNDYRAGEFLLSLLKCLLPTSDYDDLFKKKEGEDEVIAASEEKLKLRLGERLKGNKYMVVLDDMWETQTQVWDELKGAFPDDKNGSRILITSRSERIALYTGTKSPYHLPKLDKEKSWQLFCNKVFEGEDCPSDLLPWGTSIVEICDGLPLAIVVLAGLVAQMPRTPKKWSQIKDVVWPLEENERIKVMEILKLSYDYLPQKLKPCFLYFGMYPEDYEIEVKDVIQMWIAEGFIQPHEAGTQCTAEDIADHYVDELVSRSLVQVGKRRSDGSVKTCRIHDLLREVCKEECKRCEFMEVCTELNKLDKSSNLRRLSVHYKEELEMFTNNLEQLRPRSFFFFSDGNSQLPNNVVKTFKSARVLYFKTKGGLYIPPLRIEWKTMIHIRYLRIHQSYAAIPASVSRLWNLETLDVGSIWTVSSKVWTLKRLKHLYLRTIIDKKVLRKSDRKIQANLETLYLQSGDGWEEMMLLTKNAALSRLRKLVWKPNSISDEKENCGLEHFSNLQRLKISSGVVSTKSGPMQFPSSITKITLEHIYIGWGMNNLTQELGGLANLQILKLRKFFDREGELSVGGGEFPKLQVFEMSEMNLRSWRLEKGAMRSLRNLVIDNCYYLKELPQQLWSLTALRQVHVSKATQELAKSLNTVELNNDCRLTVSQLNF